MESWNSVDAYGPQVDLDRLKALCIVTGANGERTIAFERVLANPDDNRVDNFRDRKQQRVGEWAFAFDTRWCFPSDVLSELARRFPSISFHCDAIHYMDAWCGYGWFNPPPGGEEFSDRFKVPKRYWKGDSEKRTEAAALEHKSRIDDLRRAHGGEYLIS